MIAAPDAATLLEAVRELLTNEIQPTIADRGLRFKLLIAANLLHIVERELQMSEGLLAAEIDELGALLGAPPAPTTGMVDQVARARQLNELLCARIRAGDADAGPWAAAVAAHVKRALVAQLQVTNPRFLARINADA